MKLALNTLVCWGGGLYEPGTKPEQSWLFMLENVGRFAQWCLGRDLMVGFVEDPDRWVQESLDYLKKIMPYLEK